VSGSNRSVASSATSQHGALERKIANELKRRRAAGEPLPSSKDPDVKFEIPGYQGVPLTTD
jgi:hypothetical protein